jgi:3D (Asp-Asp-Asp) domain-containing protein
LTAVDFLQPEVPLTELKRFSRPSILRAAWLVTIAIIIASLQYQPSSALPLAQPMAAGMRASMPDSLLLGWRARRAHAVLPLHTTLAVADVHSLLTTPKLEAMPAAPEAASSAGLSIQTDVRTRRAFAQLNPIVRFEAGLAPGTHKTLRRGVAGIVVITERVTLWNDVVVDRQMLSHVVIRLPQAGVVLAAPPRTVAEALVISGVRKPVAVYTMVATAYTADSAQAYPTGRTATGLPARYGVVAVDPRVIKLGSRLFIPGYGTAVAADTGGAIQGNRIDLCMDSYRSAIDFGRQPVTVYVLAE